MPPCSNPPTSRQRRSLPYLMTLSRKRRPLTPSRVPRTTAADWIAHRPAALRRRRLPARARAGHQVPTLPARHRPAAIPARRAPPGDLRRALAARHRNAPPAHYSNFLAVRAARFADARCQMAADASRRYEYPPWPTTIRTYPPASMRQPEASLRSCAPRSSAVLTWETPLASSPRRCLLRRSKSERFSTTPVQRSSEPWRTTLAPLARSSTTVIALLREASRGRLGEASRARENASTRPLESGCLRRPR